MSEETKFPTNQEIEELTEKTPPSGRHIKIGLVAAIATLGSFAFGYDTGVISGALPYMQMPESAGGLELTARSEGLVGFTLLIGCAFGALFGGRLSDRFGRRHNLILIAVLFTVGAILVAVSPNLPFMYVSRFILGLAVGGASASVPVYLAETAPKRIRGTIVAIDQLMIVVGQLAAFTFNAVINTMRGGPQLVVDHDPSGHFQSGVQYSWDEITRHAASLGQGEQAFMDNLMVMSGNGDAWRWMLILCTIPAVALWIGMRFVPESPRWYAANRKYMEAIGALKRVRDDRDMPVEEEMQEIVVAQREAEHSKKGTFGAVMRTPWLRRLLIAGIIIGAQNQLTGVNTVMYYAPQVLRLAGMSTQAAITAQVANGVVSVAGSALGLYLIFRLRRRTMLLTTVAGVAVTLGSIALLFRTIIEPYTSAGEIPPLYAPIMTLVLMGVFMVFVQAFGGPVTWTILGEMFPAAFRGIMNGTAVFLLWIFNALVTFFFPIMIDAFGGSTTYAIFAVINVIMFILLYKTSPETHGRSMEEIEFEMQKRYSKPGEAAYDETH